MPGSMRLRPSGKWELRASTGRRHPTTGAYIYRQRTFEGTEPAARKALARFVTEVADGQHAHENMTFGQLLDMWLAEKATLSPTTLNEYKRIVDRQLKPTLGNVQIGKLTPPDFAALWRSLLATGLSAQSVSHVHAVARAAMNLACRWQLLPSNVVRLAPPPKVTAPEVQPPTVEELGRIVAVAKEGDPVMAMVLAIAAGIGCRRGELCGLQWGDVDVAAATVRIHRAVVEVNGKVTVKDTKTHQERTVALDEVTLGLLVGLRAVLEEQATFAGRELAESSFVISRSPDGSKPIRPELITGAFRRAREKAGVPAARLHDLRHLNASLLLAAGVPLAEVSYRLGHAKQSTTTDVYNRWTRKETGAAPAALANVLAGLAIAEASEEPSA